MPDFMNNWKFTAVIAFIYLVNGLFCIFFPPVTVFYTCMGIFDLVAAIGFALWARTEYRDA